MCPHSLRATPETCSLCLRVRPRVVTQLDGVLYVDGVAVRSVDAGDGERRIYYARRGGAAHHQRRKP